MKEDNRQKYVPCILLSDFQEAVSQARKKKKTFKQQTQNLLKLL